MVKRWNCAIDFEFAVCSQIYCIASDDDLHEDIIHHFRVCQQMKKKFFVHEISFDPFHVEHVTLWCSNHICFTCKSELISPRWLKLNVKSFVFDCIRSSNHLFLHFLYLCAHWFEFCCFNTKSVFKCTDIFTQCQVNWLWQLGKVSQYPAKISQSESVNAIK